MSPGKRGPASSRAGSLAKALDAARFGDQRTLDLHQWKPTAVQAATRVESWLQERQLQGATEVLIVTGHGAHSDDGVSPVRAAVVARLARLRRSSVVRDVREHSPGSFVVALFPISRRFDTAARRRDPKPPAPVPPAELAALGQPMLDELRSLAVAALDRLGLRAPTPGQIDLEMRAQFARLTPGVPAAPWKEPMLREAIARALDELREP
jgi:hypothetical protein